MIWNPFKKQDEINIPAFEGLEFVDKDGTVYMYKPTKTIAPHDVALLWPLAMTDRMATDRFAYIRANKLEKHFRPVKKEE
jgi:hypothetical protein